MRQVTPADFERLFENKKVPGSYQEQEILAAWVGNILERKGEEYLRRKHRKILKDWIGILKYGLSRI